MLERILAGGESGAEKAARAGRNRPRHPNRSYRVHGHSGRAQSAPPVGPARSRRRTAARESGRRGRNERADSDATLWFGDTTTALAQATVGACERLAKPCLPVYPGAAFEPSHVATWITENQVRTLYVTGNHEDAEPGIGDRVERFLSQVLRQLGHDRR